MDRPRRRVSFLRIAVLAVAITLAACGPSGSGSPSASAEASVEPEPTEEPSSAPPEDGAPAGWERHVVDRAAFALSLPEDWAAVDLTEGEMEDLLTEMYEQFPQMEEQRELFDQAFAAGFAFLAMDFSTSSISSDFVTNMNVLAQEGEIALSILAAANIQQIESTFDATVTQESVTLPAGPAVALLWGVPDSHDVVQYYLVGEGWVYIVSFSQGMGTIENGIPAIFADIMETFEPLGED